MVRELSGQALASDVTFAGLDAAVRPGVQGALSRVDLTLTLRGRYAGIKSVMNEVFGRFSNIVIQQVRIRRYGTIDQLEGTITLVVLGRPTSAPPLREE